MRKILVSAAFLSLLAATSFAQGLTIGGRVASYDTELGGGFVDLETGRENSVGFVATYRNEGLVIDGAVDHDFESAVTAHEILPLEVGDYSRDRVEGGVGFSVLPVLDIMGGARYDDVSLGGDIFGIEFFDDLNFQHQALWAGATAHSTTIRPIGWYLTGRGYFGNAKFDVQGVRVKSDTTGVKFEGGLPIPIGVSGWEITPGFEWERIETNDYDLDLKTNRFFLAFTYTTGR